MSLNKSRRGLEINKPERTQISNLMMPHRALEKEQAKPQTPRSGKEAREWKPTDKN